MISFRPITDADIPVFLDWVTRPHVAEWWRDPPAMDEIHAWCFAMGNGLPQDRHYIAMLDGFGPVGYMKSGFHAVGRVMTPDGPACLMYRDRPRS